MEENARQKHLRIKPRTADPALRRKRIGALISVGAFTLLMLLVAWYVGRPLVRFAENPAQFRAWVSAHGVWGKLAMVGMCAVQVVVALIPSEALELGAGYAFGAWEGAFLCLAGIVLGSVLVIIAVRRFGMRFIELFYTREQIASVSFLQDGVRVKALLLLIFAVPGTPKDLVTYTVGLLPVSVRWYVLCTSVARFPSIIMSTFAGAAAGEQAYTRAILLFAAGAAIGLSGFLFYTWLRKRRTRE